jgi:hypothetical protein
MKPPKTNKTTISTEIARMPKFKSTPQIISTHETAVLVCTTAQQVGTQTDDSNLHRQMERCNLLAAVSRYVHVPDDNTGMYLDGQRIK